MTLASLRSNGPRVAVKMAVSRPPGPNGTAGTAGDHSVTATPGGSKDDSLSPSMSPDVKMASSDSVSTPETGPSKAATSSSTRRAASTAKPAASPPNRLLFDHLPDATDEAKRQFQVITDCLYGSKHMGSSDHDALECDCTAEWHDDQNLACGEDSDCINRATKIECVRGDCNCGDACQNQRFQRKQYAQVSVIRTDKKGYGLRADADLHAHDFIYEYIGEVINEPAFRRRMLQYDEEGIKHFYFMSLTKNEFVDATRKGNLGRFCNHSCNPNCYVDKWVVGEKLRMGIFAGRHIQAGEELVFDYNVDRYGAEPQPCYCGEANCSGFIGGKTQTERATKLPQATIEALGIEDLDGWADVTAATSRKTPAAATAQRRRKRPNEDDEEYVNSLQQSGLTEDGVTKVMAALMQCKERWIAVKLLARIQAAAARDDERVLHRVVRMHGYQILSTTLTAFRSDDNVVLQVLDILDRLPRLTKNKISDSNIESVIEGLAAADNDDVAAKARCLLDAWSKLETGYRIPRKKQADHATPTTSSYEDDRRRGDTMSTTTTAKDDDVASNGSGAARGRPPPRAPLSPFHGKVIPKGPRSNIPRHASFYGAGASNGSSTPRNRRGHDGLLPAGWFEAKDPNGTTYYYAPGRAATWKRPTQPADKAPTKAQQQNNAVQEIINSIVKEDTPRPSASHTPQPARTPTASQEQWRAFSIDKQKRVYENTLFPHIKSVTDKYHHRLPKEELKKFAKDISKKLVASDYKNNRVDDPTKITPRVEKKVKAYVREFFERAVVKYEEHTKRKAARDARDDAHDISRDVSMAEDADEPTDGQSLECRKRKRPASEAVSQAPPSPTLAKRLKERDDSPAAPDSIPTPPTPPPPPPPEDDEQQALREQEEALVRENEEAMREFDVASASKQQLKDTNGHAH